MNVWATITTQLAALSDRETRVFLNFIISCPAAVRTVPEAFCLAAVRAYVADHTL